MDTYTEYIDLYDENRNPLNKTHNRQNKLQKGEFITVVGIWLVSSDGRILLTKRHPDKTYAPNTWENTAGHVLAGETSEQAVIRELREETGIAVEPGQMTFLGTAKVPPYFGDNYIVLLDAKNLPEIRLQPGETCDARWVTYRHFLQMAEQNELAPSIMTHLSPLRGKFEDFLRGCS